MGRFKKVPKREQLYQHMNILHYHAYMLKLGKFEPGVSINNTYDLHSILYRIRKIIKRPLIYDYV